MSEENVQPAGDPGCSGADLPPNPDIDRVVPIASWAMYDFANTVYSGIIITAFLPPYIAYELGYSKTMVGVTTTLSFVASALLSPLLGCIPDKTGKTKQYLLITTLVCILCTAGLSGFTSPIAALLLVYFTANVCYTVALTFYNALLPVVSSPKTQSMASGLGVALGYVGVIFAVLLASKFILPVETGDSRDQLSGWKFKGMNKDNSKNSRVFASLDRIAEQGGDSLVVSLYRAGSMSKDELVATGRTAPGTVMPAKIDFEQVGSSGLSGKVTIDRFDAPVSGVVVGDTLRWVFLVAAALFLVFTLPLVFFVPERKVKSPQRLTLSVAAGGFRTVLRTVAGLPRNRNMLLFLVANLLCVDVLNTAIQWFSTYFIYVFSFNKDQIIQLMIGMSAAAFGAGIVMGKVTDWLGSRRAMLLASVLLICAVACVALTTSAAVAVAGICGVGALGLAGLWVAGRKLLIELSPPERIGEYFGLYGIAVRISVIGTTLFAVLAETLRYSESTNYRIAILVQLCLIVPGTICLWFVKAPVAPGLKLVSEP